MGGKLVDYFNCSWEVELDIIEIKFNYLVVGVGFEIWDVLILR